MAKWLFICSKCGHGLEQDEVIASRCPECGASSWLYHLTDHDDNHDNDPEPGEFYCKACLMDKTEAEMSPDDRYCQGCYEFLLKEAEILSQGKRTAWIPKPVARSSFKTRQDAQNKANACNNIIGPSKPRVGRPVTDLPVQQIEVLKSQGYSLRGIAERLGTSHMAVKRALERANHG